MATPIMPVFFQSAVKQENQPPQQPSSAKQSNPLLHVKAEPQNLPIIALPQQKEPQFFKLIDELGNVSAAINAFRSRFDELQKHLDFIRHAIDARSNDLASSSGEKEEQGPPQEIQTETVLTRQTESPIAKTAVPETPTATTSRKKSELVSLCETMCSKGLRKYVLSNLSNLSKLRVEVPLALKSAPKPAKLVLECIGRFFLQGSKAYAKQSPMVSGREASVLLLEFFLRTIDNEVQLEGFVKQEAEQAAVAWKKRLIAEGGLSSASEIDARGLLLLIASYGIPRIFKNEDIWNLVRVCNSRPIAEALRRSRILVTRISDIMEGMMKNGMKVEAVDIASTFGIENKFPPQKLLSSYLRESNEAFKRRKRESNNSPLLLKEANEKLLAALKSVMKCLDDRKLDPAKTVPGWQFEEKILKLEKDIADLKRRLDERAIAKRKADQNQISNNLKCQEAKRQRFTTHGLPLSASPNIGLHDQRLISHADVKVSYGGAQIDLLDARFSSHVNNYPATTSMLYESGAGSLPENATDTIAGVGGAMQNAGVGLAAVYGGPSTSSLTGVQGEVPMDRRVHVSSNGPSYGWHEVADTTYSDRLQHQSYGRQPSSGMYLLPSPVEGFAGLPNSSSLSVAGVRSSASDLYHFADSVMEGDYSSAGRKAVQLPPVVGPHYSACMQ